MSNDILNNIESTIKKKSTSRDMYRIIFTTEDNRDIEYEIIATFKSKSREKIYYIMTDNTRSEDNSLKISAFYINYDDEKSEPSEINERFYPVIDESELKMVLDVFNNIQSNI